MSKTTIDERSIKEFLGRKNKEKSREVINDTVSEMSRYKAQYYPRVIYRRKRERSGSTLIYPKIEINISRWQDQLSEQVKAGASISKLCLTVLTSGNAVSSPDFVKAIQEAGKKDIKSSNIPAILADIRDSEANKVINTQKEGRKWVYKLKAEAQGMSVEALYNLYKKTGGYCLKNAAEDYPDLKSLLVGDKKFG
jgi:hypothetical protein